jgi:hypothetical protein
VSATAVVKKNMNLLHWLDFGTDWRSFARARSMPCG